MTVTYTEAEWRSFKSGKEVIADLQKRGIRNPRAATQTRNPDGSMTFEAT